MLILLNCHAQFCQYFICTSPSLKHTVLHAFDRVLRYLLFYAKKMKYCTYLLEIPAKSRNRAYCFSLTAHFKPKFRRFFTKKV
jgi:hypothetical protein